MCDYGSWSRNPFSTTHSYKTESYVTGGRSTAYFKNVLQLKNKIKNIVVTVGEHSEDLVIYVLENGGTKVLSTLYKGNCWWLFNSEIREIDEPVLVLPCDNITNLNLPFIYDNYQQLGSPPCMVVPISPKHEIEGDFISSNNGIVTAISRNVKQPIYCSGIQVVNPKTVNNLCKQNEDFSDVWNELISIQGLTCSSIYPEKWYSINTVEQLNIYNETQVQNENLSLRFTVKDHL